MEKPWFKLAFGVLQPASWQGWLCALALVASLTGWSVAFFGIAFGGIPSTVEKVVWFSGVIAMGIAYSVVQARTSGRNK